MQKEKTTEIDNQTEKKSKKEITITIPYPSGTTYTELLKPYLDYYKIGCKYND